MSSLRTARTTTGKTTPKGMGVQFIAGLDSGAVLFMTALALHVVTFILFQSTAIIFFPSRFTSASLAACTGMLILSELLGGRWTPASIVGLIALSAVAVVTIQSSANTIFVIAMFVFVARNYKFRSMAKTAFAAMLVTCIIVFTLALLGVSLNHVWYQGARVRYGLGFRYTTYLSHYLLYATMILVYLRGGRIGWPVTLAIVVLNLLIFAATDSRNSFTLTFAILAIAPILGKLEESGRIGPKLLIAVAVAAVPLIALASLYLMTCYTPSSPWMVQLNCFLGGRLQIANRAYTLYGISAFGQSFNTAGQGLSTALQMSTFDYGVTFIDNSYCSILLHQGVVILVMVVACFSATMGKMAANGKYVALFILAVVSAHSFIDSWLITLQYNVFLLLIGTCLLSEKRRGHAVKRRTVLERVHNVGISTMETRTDAPLA